MEISRRGKQDHGPWWQRWRVEEWCVCVVMFVIAISADHASVHIQFVPQGDGELAYPLQTNTVAMWVNYIVSGVVPACIMALWSGVIVRDIDDAIASVTGLASSLSTVSAVTNVIKFVVGRPRPNYYADVLVNEQDARRSFVSGHTSWAFAGQVFLSLWLLGKCRLHCQRSRRSPSPLTRTVLSLVPTLVAVWIALTRLTDYHHHYSDVLAAACIGTVGACLVYRLNFPSIFDRFAPDKPISAQPPVNAIGANVVVEQVNVP